ncbi:Rid family hydrolase [Bordetella genomosp. 13]|uniref:Enamine deaminase RidA n=1 Tax=Bordetella genomosp. 13 TaxID=463040 RepID=A0A1W6ZHQ1_9BORD|nr:Rid family hydrolase [Bordetella genomosp. 13]ARP96832.1 hypothetical protein CAL15_22180 [Bordetella genomosp. 13]
MPTPQRYAASGSASAISRAVAVPPGLTHYQLSAQYPAVIDANAPPDSMAALGDTAAQTSTTLARLEGVLKEMGLGLEHLTHVRVYLVADPATGAMDFDGFNAAYNAYLRERIREFPARTVLQVAGLVRPNWLIEIEACAAA